MAFYLYIGSHDTLCLITLMQLVLFILYATMGQAGDTLVVKDIVHKQIYFQMKESHVSHS